MHISRTFKEIEKPDIEMIKADIEKQFQPKIESHILKLREAFPGGSIFGRFDMMKIIDLVLRYAVSGYMDGKTNDGVNIAIRENFDKF